MQAIELTPHIWIGITMEHLYGMMQMDIQTTLLAHPGLQMEHINTPTIRMGLLAL